MAGSGCPNRAPANWVIYRKSEAKPPLEPPVFNGRMTQHLGAESATNGAHRWTYSQEKTIWNRKEIQAQINSINLDIYMVYIYIYIYTCMHAYKRLFLYRFYFYLFILFFLLFFSFLDWIGLNSGFGCGVSLWGAPWKTLCGCRCQALAGLVIGWLSAFRVWANESNQNVLEKSIIMN